MPWLVIVVGYFLGSIPTAYIAGHLSKGIDIRRVGDENAGAANVYRQLSAKAGIIVGLIDAGKGALAVLIAQAASVPQLAVVVAGAAAVIGHSYPVFSGFRGGRGVSTAIGVLLVLVTKPMLIVTAPALATLIIKRNVNLACAVLFIPLWLICWLRGVSDLLTGYSVFLPCLLGFTHFLRTRHPVARHI